MVRSALCGRQRRQCCCHGLTLGEELIEESCTKPGYSSYLHDPFAVVATAEVGMSGRVAQDVAAVDSRTGQETREFVDGERDIVVAAAKIAAGRGCAAAAVEQAVVEIGFAVLAEKRSATELSRSPFQDEEEAPWQVSAGKSCMMGWCSDFECSARNKLVMQVWIAGSYDKMDCDSC